VFLEATPETQDKTLMAATAQASVLCMGMQPIPKWHTPHTSSTQSYPSVESTTQHANAQHAYEKRRHAAHRSVYLVQTQPYSQQQQPTLSIGSRKQKRMAIALPYGVVQQRAMRLDCTQAFGKTSIASQPIPISTALTHHQPARSSATLSNHSCPQKKSQRIATSRTRAAISWHNAVYGTAGHKYSCE
jgi:hypothetical protein